jgi:hypothetical protein
MPKTPSRHLRTVIGVGLTSFISVAIIYAIAHAGNLQPPGSPGSTMYTLTDIYNRLTTNATATEGGHSFDPPAGIPASTMYTLTQVYSAIPTIDPNTVASSTTYLGIKGTLLGNMFNGTGQGFTGGSQAKGGIDDYNNTGSPPSDRYAKGWTQCTSGNSYCGTGDSGADAKDNSTGLVWSMPCNGSGCSSFSDSSPLTYTWGTSGGNNNSASSTALCANHSGWFLPHQKQLMQAYIDGSYGNLEASGVDRAYWSGTTVSNGVTSAWYTYLDEGFTFYTAKTSINSVRCVRPAN